MIIRYMPVSLRELYLIADNRPKSTAHCQPSPKFKIIPYFYEASGTKAYIQNK